MNDRQRRFLDATLPHLDTVYRVARHTAAAQDQAEDLVQETYLHAYRAFDDQQRPNTREWIVSICLGLARTDWRRRDRRLREEPLGELAAATSSTGEVVDVVVQHLYRDAVTRVVRSLPGDQRMAVILMDIAGHTAAEASSLLSCPRTTVLARVHRGRRRLARILADEGTDHDLH